MEAHRESFKVETIRKAFKNSGIHPVNPDIFTDEDYAPSAPTSIYARFPPSFPVPDVCPYCDGLQEDDSDDESDLGVDEDEETSSDSELEEGVDDDNGDIEMDDDDDGQNAGRSGAEVRSGSPSSPSSPTSSDIHTRRSTPATAIETERSSHRSLATTESIQSITAPDTHRKRPSHDAMPFKDHWTDERKLRAAMGEIKRLKHELRSAEGTIDSMASNCALAAHKLNKVQMRLNKKRGKKKSETVSLGSRLLTSGEGRVAFEKELEEKRKKAEKKREAEERKRAAAAAKVAQREARG
ncbi:hypothetical protein DFP72DRAFT_956785, partial [Ephemerocybe angulata]